MKKFSLFFGAAMLAAAFGYAGIQDGVLLRRELKPGKDVYTMDMKMVQTVGLGSAGMGDQQMDINTTMKVAFNVGEAADGKAPLEMVMSDVQMKMDGPMASMAESMMGSMPKTITTKGKLDALNRMSDMQVVEKGAAAMMAMSGATSNLALFVEFPEKPVKVGDTWTVNVPKNEMAGMEAAKLTAKLVGEKDGAWHITMSGDIPMKMDMGEMAKKNPQIAESMPMPMNMLITGTVNLTSDMLVEKGTGRTLSMDVKAKSATKINMPDMGMSFDSTGTGTITMKLAK